MGTTRDGSIQILVIDCVSQESKVFKSIVYVVLIGLVIGGTSSMPQRSNVFFPSNTNRNPMKNPNGNQTSQVPVLRPNGHDNSNGFNDNDNQFVGSSQGHNQLQQQQQNAVFQQGNTGISCNRPGDFVMAPDGCNSCFCADNGQLSSVCSRAFCPPGFPSGSQGQFRL